MAKYFLLFTLLSTIVSSHALSHNEALQRLQDAGITVSSSGNCSTRSIRTCTSLDEIRENTINGLITLKQASGCSINVTGGTENEPMVQNPDFPKYSPPVRKALQGKPDWNEWQQVGKTFPETTGHSSTQAKSHWNGYKADISLNSCINDYITTRFTYVGKRSDGARKYRSASGNIYAKEGNHWDILYI